MRGTVEFTVLCAANSHLEMSANGNGKQGGLNVDSMAIHRPSHSSPDIRCPINLYMVVVASASGASGEDNNQAALISGARGLIFSF
jgi:hypothetical protein